ncbi:ATPases of the AAA+ class [hydrothermal vent metagenome]|uniref:ATPases of the AAA+ class n=1 Tax=hydrothermal vent metagenome TaxID=652676 RepID=A0A1W1E6J1_9ZZZZ
MRFSAEKFAQSKHKRLTLLGMSGVGKTHLSKLLLIPFIKTNDTKSTNYCPF